jgi:DNA-directed RNA polymerase specialized sigma24 family protein
MHPSRDDAAVFTRIFDQHRHAVHAYFIGRVTDPELAADLLQETFLRVWRRLSEVGVLADDQQRGPRRAARHHPLSAQPGPQAARRRARPGGG